MVLSQTTAGEEKGKNSNTLYTQPRNFLFRRPALVVSFKGSSPGANLFEIFPQACSTFVFVSLHVFCTCLQCSTQATQKFRLKKTLCTTPTLPALYNADSTSRATLAGCRRACFTTGVVRSLFRLEFCRLESCRLVIRSDGGRLPL